MDGPDPAMSDAPQPDDLPDGEPVAAPRRPWRVVLLALVLVGSVYVAADQSRSAAFVLQAGGPSDCGEVGPGRGADLPDDRFCRLTGTVAGLDLAVAGDPVDPHADLRTRSAGRKLYARLYGDRVFAVLAADRPDVLAWRERHAGVLPGFVVQGEGRVLDPDRDPAYQGVAAMLRQRYGLAADQPIRVFDTTDRPLDHWPHALALVLMTANAALALFGLVRIARRRRDVNSPPLSD
jgi:hypothetical protein